MVARTCRDPVAAGGITIHHPPSSVTLHMEEPNTMLDFIVDACHPVRRQAGASVQQHVDLQAGGH